MVRIILAHAIAALLFLYRVGDHINTKLNFTDTDSMLSVSSHSQILHVEDGKQQENLAKSDLENKVVLYYTIPAMLLL